MKTLRSLIASGALATAMVAGSPAAAQGGGDQYMGQLMLVGFGYCPSGGWIEANGQSLSIAQYSALFSLFGTTYGGDGVQTFNVPDLRGRVVLHTGNPPSGGSYPLGQTGGNATVTLSTSQMPAHNHSFNATQQPPNTDNPSGSVLADFPEGTPIYNNQVPPNVAMNTQSVGVTGGSAPVPVRDPYLVMRWCVATTGIYPSRP